MCMSIDTPGKKNEEKNIRLLFAPRWGSGEERGGELTKKRDMRRETKLLRGNERARDRSESIKQIDLTIYGVHTTSHISPC